MLNPLNRLLRRGSYQPLNKILISKTALVSNFRYISRINRKIKIAPVLKSNGYGHGVLEIARILDPLGAPFFCVDSIFEAYQLLKGKVKTPILIMGYIDPENLKVKRLPFQYAIWDLELAKALNRYQKGAQVHIFVDTGMHREGIVMENLDQFIKELQQFENIEIVGLMSHFADAEDRNSPHTRLQTKNFQKALKLTEKNGLKLKWRHISNSAGLLNTPNREGNLARVGLALYTINPVLRMTSKIIQIKTIKKGEKVGYRGTYTAKKETLVGILPLGYNDGMDRRLSNKGVVKVRDIVCPILGRISMNITAIDLSRVKNSQIGEAVEIISDNPKDPNSLENIAKTCGTIPYDILVNIVSTTRREVVD